MAQDESYQRFAKNCRVGKVFATMSNGLASLLFFTAYLIADNVWLLVASIICFLTAIAMYVFFSKYERKYLNLWKNNCNTKE